MYSSMGNISTPTKFNCVGVEVLPMEEYILQEMFFLAYALKYEGFFSRSPLFLEDVEYFGESSPDSYRKVRM